MAEETGMPSEAQTSEIASYSGTVTYMATTR